MSGKIVMIGSMKGGVSKTVTTFNLAYSLSKLGKKVLAVDFDSQANLSTCLGVEDVATVPVTIGNLMLAQIEEEELPKRSEYIQTRNGIDFISSSMVLSAVDAKLRLEMGSEKMLSDILETLRDSYDYILIDTSPSSLVMFHKHRFRYPYHQHGRANTLRQAVKSIQGHDKWQMVINTQN